MAKDYDALARAILTGIGGEANVSHLDHCSTRLRFSVRDHSKVDQDALKATKGVLAVVDNGVQCQVVIGNDVIEAYDALNKIGSFEGGEVPDDTPKGEKASMGARILDFLVGVFQPLVPAIAGAGILKAFLSLFSLLGWLSSDSSLYVILYNAADAALYFLPIMVGYTMANKLKLDKCVAIAITGAMLLPNIVTALSDGTALFGVTLQNIAYSYQVFPAILSIGLLYFVERFFTKISPKSIRDFFVPMMSILICVPATLLVLGPLGYNIGQLVTTVILFVYNTLGWFAVPLLAALLPFMIALGMHKALLPYAVSAITSAGEEMLYMPASLAHNISEGGACLAVAIKTKNDDLRAAAISAGISGIFGITEPALYGVTLQHKRAMAGVVTGCVLGGLVIGITGVKAFVAMGPGLAGMAMFVDPANAMNVIWAFVGFGVSLASSFVATLFLYHDEDAETADGKATATAKA